MIFKIKGKYRKINQYRVGRLLYQIEQRKDWLDRNFKLLHYKNFGVWPEFNFQDIFAQDFELHRLFCLLEQEVQTNQSAYNALEKKLKLC